MCVLALLYRTARNTPILLAANREERFDRPTQHPKIQPGRPRVICGTDRQAGGTWLGVNQHGLLVAVSNRPKAMTVAEPRSRGLLCRELLNIRNAKEAAKHAAAELATGNYAGANYICADAHYAAIIHGGPRVEVVELKPGLHVVTNGNINDIKDERQQYIRRMLTLHTLDSAVTFLAVASRAFSRQGDTFGRRGIVIDDGDFGTVSSTLVALPKRIQQAVYQYAPGPPSVTPYDDLSALLRQVLSADRGQKKSASKPDAKATSPAKAAASPSKVKVKKK